MAEVLVEVARQAGLGPVVTSTRRSRTKQAALYRRFLEGKSRLPALPPGRSLHEHGLAFDMVLARGGDEGLRALGELWKSWGGQWGGDARIGYDPVHFQLKQLL